MGMPFAGKIRKALSRRGPLMKVGCATCSVASDPQFAKGIIFGVISLGVVLVLVLVFVIRFLIRFSARAKASKQDKGTA